MKNLYSVSLVVISVALLSSCSFSGKKNPDLADGSETAQAAESAKLWVVKSDRSKSCEATSGISVDTDQESLSKKSVQVFESRKGDDGQMHVQMCGADTGKLNAYLILESDLEKAKEVGFAKAPDSFK